MPLPAKTHVAPLFRAFSDPLRLRILNLLQQRELCVCDLVDVLSVPQPTVSRHLSYLRKAGLIEVRRTGSWNYYTLMPPRKGLHAKLLESLGCCLSELPDLRTDLSNVKNVQERGGRCPS